MKILSNNMYLLLINEKAEIKEENYYLDDTNSLFTPQHNFFAIKSFNKIIAYYPLTEEAKELGLPLLPNPNVSKEVDIEKLAQSYLHSRFDLSYERTTWQRLHEETFTAGYKAAQSKQFTLEDMKKAFEAGANWQEGGTILYPDIHGFAQSLSTQQTYPKEFIPDYEITPMGKVAIELGAKEEDVKTLKTITNSEGKQELVGTYC